MNYLDEFERSQFHENNLRFLELFEKELKHLRTTAADFARLYPKAGKYLNLDPNDIMGADPYVERLLEGFAFLTARIQSKFDEQFPRITQRLFESVFPQYIAPIPSMTIVRFEPQLDDSILADGPEMKRGTALSSRLDEKHQTRCTYCTAHNVQLWPIEIAFAEYIEGGLPAALLPPIEAEAAIRIRLRATAGLTFDAIENLDHLTLYLPGIGDEAFKLYEQILGHCVRTAIHSPIQGGRRQRGGGKRNLRILKPDAIKRVGFDNEHALYPVTRQSFQGYRLLREYFALPQRFLFFRIEGIGQLARELGGNEIEVFLWLDQKDPELVVDAGKFALFCTPAINLFEHNTIVELSDRESEHQVIPDKWRPLDYEVFQIMDNVEGRGDRADERQVFSPFYTMKNEDEHGRSRAYYATHRAPRTLTQHERSQGSFRSPRYPGTEVYLSLVDESGAPFRPETKKLVVKTLCTNRDLPLLTQWYDQKIDFPSVSPTGPIRGTFCMVHPTPPMPPFAAGETAWRLISHMSLNYQSLVNARNGGGTKALRALLKLYAESASEDAPDPMQGLQLVQTKPISDFINGAYVRGLQIDVTLDESKFGRSGVFVFGAVLEQFFAKYVAINSFTQTVVRSSNRGEIKKWPMRTGRRNVI